LCRIHASGFSEVSMTLQGQRVLLCVCGGIAAYKAADLVRRLREAGAEVRVAMTENAQRFVGAQTFQALSGQPVRSSLWDAQAEAAMGHLELARWAQRIVVAPATANTLAKLAHGFADDLVSTLCLASTAPITVCPAMNHVMWKHPATRQNMATVRERGVQVVGPDDGPLAEGESGPGRMAEPLAIVAALAAART
jgi:phosphopantothenoylcysteine decarboxylase/phosphopantothenate--cysteine ligase